MQIKEEKGKKEEKIVRAIYLPYCAARSSADSPRLLRMLGSHPYCNSCATTSVCPYCAAQCNAVSLSFVCDHTKPVFRVNGYTLFRLLALERSNSKQHGYVKLLTNRRKGRSICIGTSDQIFIGQKRSLTQILDCVRFRDRYEWN